MKNKQHCLFFSVVCMHACGGHIVTLCVHVEHVPAKHRLFRENKKNRQIVEIRRLEKIEKK